MNNRFKALRKALKLKQDEIAKILNKSTRMIQYYEQGKFEIETDSLFKLHELYDVNLNWLISGIGNMFLSDNEKKADSGVVSIAPTYDLPERFLQLCCKLKKEDFIRVEGYIQAIVDSYKNKDMQKLSS